MARSIEPYSDQELPNQFQRWIETLRIRVGTIPCWTYFTGSPEGVVNGQKGDYYFDNTANVYYFKSTNTGNTGWLLLHPFATATTVQLVDITNAINTAVAKVLGFAVLNTTTGVTVFASGNADGDVWEFYDESLAHTPV